MNQTTNSGRIYAWDALRAIMMLLGIVLHAAITYGSHDYGTFWPIKNPENSILFDLMVALIHFFRMPVFFVAAGYFGALLFYKKGSKQMLTNRVKRIFLPLLAGVLIVYPLAIFAFSYTAAAFIHAAKPFNVAWNVIVSGRFLPFSVLHLWFLYFLILYSFMGWLVARLFNRETAFTTLSKTLFTYILQNSWLRVGVLSALYFICLWWIGEPSLTTNNKWSIELPIFMTYFLFFETGWVIFVTKTLEKLSNCPKRQLGVAALLFLTFIFTPWGDSIETLYVREGLAALFGVLFIFGFIALFMTYFNTRSRVLSYIMDASYWVYIIHLPIVAFLPGLFAAFAIPVFFKFLMALSLTTFICFASYHFAVRNSFIGKFLTGKTHKSSNNWGEK